MQDVKFMAIYQICYSTANGEGMLYTIHRISSPKLLLQKLWESYELNLEVSLKTSLNHGKDINNESSNEVRTTPYGHMSSIFDQCF